MIRLFRFPLTGLLALTLALLSSAGVAAYAKACAPTQGAVAAMSGSASSARTVAEMVVPGDRRVPVAGIPMSPAERRYRWHRGAARRLGRELLSVRTPPSNQGSNPLALALSGDSRVRAGRDGEALTSDDPTETWSSRAPPTGN